MKIRSLAFLATILVSGHAFAWDCVANPSYWYLNVAGNECYHNGPAPTLPGYPAGSTNAQAGSLSNSLSHSDSSSQSRSSSTSGSSSSNGSSDSQTSVYESSRIPVGTAIAGIGVTTAGCRFAEGLGVQTMPAGTSIGISLKDHDCVRLQLAQFLYSRGQDIAGDRVTCQITEIHQALGDDCLALVHQVEASHAVYPTGEVERRKARVGWDQVQK